MIPYTTIRDIALGPITIQFWGLMVATGIATALILALKQARKVGIKQAWVYDIVFYSIISGIVGSRLGYILFYWPQDTPLTLFNAINITKGGLAFAFGLAAAVAVSIIYMRAKKINIRKFVDFIAPYIVIGHAIGRIGCYFTGDHLGKTTGFFLGMMYNGAVRHNTALYDIAALLTILAILLYIKRFKLFDGLVFASYIFMYSILRFAIDFFRIDKLYYGLTATQYLLILTSIASGIFLLARLSKRR